MGIAVLGPLTVNGSGRLSRRDRVVLEALATRPGRPVSADQLLDALWGDAPPPSAPKILQGCIVRLRKLLGAEAIETSAHGYLLAVSPDQLDALDFARVVERARELLTLGEADRAAYQLTEALGWWRGDAFADLEGWSPAQTEVHRLGELRLEAEELRTDALLRAGRPREVLAEAQSLVRAEPLRERRWTLLARAQYQSGQQGDALRTLHQLRGVLVDQLGIDPGPEVTALEGAILRQDASLLTAGDAVSASTTCPYLGLRAFEVDDADRFFGRQQDVEACLAILGRSPLLALVGPSGSGKSSILRAGVAAALHRRGTPTLLITPGPRPAETLTGLAGRPVGTVLLVDQFEEVFTLCGDPREQQAFLRDLTEEAARRTVVIALRADHLVDLASDHALSRLVEQGLYLVGGLSDDGLRAAVELPARQAGLTIEPGLVDLLVREVEGDPGALPLLSHALLETWKRREGNTLTVAGYRASGGIHGAVAQSAELLYARIEAARRPLLRDLVLRLVSPGVQGEPVRARVPRRLVATDAEREQIIEMLVGARLVTSDEGVLEISHEALARAWPRLRGWLDDDVEGQRTLHHLSAASDAWDSLGRPDSELYRGVRLARALDWQQHSATTLTPTERDFLAASSALAEAEERSAAERARVQARLIRRLRLVLSGAVALLVLAMVAGGAAVVQSRTASRNSVAARAAEDSAQTQALRAEVSNAGARAEIEDNIDRSLLLAASAVELEDSPESLSSLTTVVSKHPGLIASSTLPGAQASALEVSPDGLRAATMTAAHGVALVDLATGRLLGTAQAGAARAESIPFRGLGFSPDGGVLAAGRTVGSPGPVSLLDGHTLRRLPVQPGWRLPGRWEVADLTFSHDGSSVAAALWRIGVRDGSVQPVRAVAAVWRLADLRRPRLVDLTGSRQVSYLAGYLSIALSPHADRLYALPDRRVYDVASGVGHRFTSAPVGHDVGGIELSPDGRLLAFGIIDVDHPDRSGGAVLVDARSGRVVRRLVSHLEVADVRFSRSGTRLLTTDWPGGPLSPRLWDVRSGRPIGTLSIPPGVPAAVALTPDGKTVVSAGSDQALRTWDPTGAHNYLRPIRFHGPLPGSCFATPSDGGRFVAYLPCGFEQPALSDSYVFLDVARRRTHLVRHAYPGWSLGGGSWMPDGRTFVRADGGTIRGFDGRTGARLASRHPLSDRITDVDHSPDGRELVAAEENGKVTMLDPATYEPRGKPVDLGPAVCCISAGPQGTAFAVFGGLEVAGFWNDPAGQWALVDLIHGRVVQRGELDIGTAYWATYSPDGRLAAVTGADGEIEIIDVQSGHPVRAPVTAHGAGVYWATFSPDGTRLVSTATDGSVVLWDAATSTPLARVDVQADFTSAAFRPDGRTLLITPWEIPTGGHPLYVWDPSSSRAVAFACRMASRDLTREEWQDTYGSRPYRPTCPDH